MGRSLQNRGTLMGNDHAVPDPADLETVAKAIAYLKQRVRRTQDLSEPFSLFFDYVSPMVMNEPGAKSEKNPEMEEVLSKIMRQIMRQQGRITVPRFWHLAEHQFWHGSFFFDSRMGAFFYFEGIDIGMALLISSFDFDNPRSEHVRFSLTETPPGTVNVRERGSA